MSISRRILVVAGALALGLAACATPEPSGPPEPASVSASSLQPGLAVLYFYGDFELIDNMPKTPAELAKGQRGKPVPNLNDSSNQGKMWDANANVLYGAHFTGFIKLDAGEYSFTAKSNDGVRVLLDKMRIADDPTAHPARFSQPVKVNITKPGWYPLTVQYFQRQGSAQLELHWQPPGAAGPSIVPPTALAHTPG